MKRGDQTFRIEDYAFIASIIVISIASLIACADLLHFMIAVQRNSSILSLFTWICIPLYIIILIITGFILAYVFENEDFAFGFAILGMPLIVVISGGILMAFSPFSVFYEKYGQWGAYGIAVTCGLIIHLCAIYNCAAYSLIGKIVNHTCSLGEKYSLGIFLTFHYSIFLLLILIIRHDIILDGLILCWPGFLSFGLLLLNYIKNYAEGVRSIIKGIGYMCILIGLLMMSPIISYFELYGVSKMILSYAIYTIAGMLIVATIRGYPEFL